MRFRVPATSLVLAVALISSNGAAQTTPSTPTNSQPQTASGAAPTAGGTAPPAAGGTPPPADGTAKTAETVAQQVKDVKAIRDALNADSDLDFSLVVGIASLIVVSGSTDYSDQSNVIHSNYLGKATPQFLAGVSFRSHLPNILPRYHGCPWDQKAPAATGATDTTQTAGTSPPAGSQIVKTPTVGTVAEQVKDVKTIEDALRAKDKPGNACDYAEPWQKRPWNAFVSVKFAPGASQTVNGFVFGASYAITKYLSALVGFSLTPINEPAPGFRTAAVQFVTAEQKQGQYLNFNPIAMQNSSPNAFDGFPVTDPTGKLIYSGNPLTVHYHGGAVFGVSIPIYFSSVFK
jgi:hypothetical protein